MTLKEKLIIVAIILLLAVGLIIGPAQAQEPPPEVLTEDDRVWLIENSIIIGREMDTVPYLIWLQATYNDGPPVSNMVIAMKAATCYILWNALIELNPETDLFTIDDLQVSAWRAYQSTIEYVVQAGGDPSRINSFLIPALIQEGAGQFTQGGIAECTVLDGAIFEDMEMNGVTPVPPEGEETPKVEPKSGGIAS
jgi:hypothetical protein